MQWDSLLVAATVAELSGHLDGGRVRAVHFDRHARRVALYLRERTVLFDLSPSSGAIVFLDPAEPSAGALPLASLIRGVSCPPDERVITLDITRLRGRARRVQLVIELLTNAWNAILTEGGDGRIRSVLRRRQSTDRLLQPGVSYRPPRPSGRKGRREPIALDAWLEILADVEASERTPTLVRNVAFTSRLNAAAFLGGSSGDGAGDVESALEEGWSRWMDWRALRAVEPRVLTTPQGPQPYPYPVPGLDGEHRDSLIAALSDAAATGDDPRALLVPAELIEALAERVRAGESKLSRLQDQLVQLGDPARSRAHGDLLLSRMQNVPRGASSVSLEGFEGKTIRISLDPTLAPHQNAARYYDRAARSERAAETLPGLIEEAGTELETWYALEEGVREGNVDLDELRRRVGEPRPGRGQRGDLMPRLPYHRFRSSVGTEIRVGRNAHSNDDLTFHHSDPDDVWLHARHGAGAHVILRWRGEGSPAPRDLEEAATLAAVNSKGRSAGSVPVDWTRRKYVRKPRKAPAGTVVMERAKTVFVTPDPTIVDKLRWTDEG